MIINLLINTVVLLFGAVFSIMPVVGLDSIPIIGDTLHAVFVDMALTWNAFIVTFPYAGVAWNVFLMLIIFFEMPLIALKFFLGSRSPDKD